MSIVAEILSSRDKAEIEDFKSKIGDLSIKINHFKSDAKKALNSRYVQFKAQLDESKNLAFKLQALSTRMSELELRIEKKTKADLQNSTSELKSLSRELQEMNIKIHVVKQLVEIDLKLKTGKAEMKNKNYHQVAEILCEVKKLTQSTEVKDECDPELMKQMKKEAIFISEKFLYDVSNLWRETVICEKVDDDSALMFIISIEVSNVNSFTQLVQALHLYEELSLKMKLLADKLLENIVTTLMTKSCTIDITSTSDALQVTVVGATRPEPSDVIQKLKEVFHFLNSVLEVQVTSNLTLMNLLGQKMANEFCDLFIKQILTDAIPSNNREREAYEKVVQETLELQEFLETIGFLSGSNQTIMEYAMNVDVHFANKLCEMTMSKARTIMKQDLHDTVEIEPKFPEVTALSATLDRDEADQSDSFASLSSSTLQFPKCTISKSVLELMQLIYTILKEASTSSEMRAVRLYCSARKIIEMYCAITPAHHKKFLDTLPQQAALFHNNCMYLAHQMMMLGSEFNALLSPVLPAQSLTFVDLMTKLRQTGAQVFLGQMQTQRKQLLDILRDSGLSTLGEGDRLPPTTEKCIRQCLRQLELLQRVWQNVLPSHVYNKAIGTVLNTLVEELIVRVCTAEDIPAETATDLVTVFTTVLDRAPRVLLEAGEIHQNVKRWRAFEELVQVLGANLQGIDNRWAQGKGPLAHEFSPDQVKQLVRALFQNTTRRAALLAKIK